MAPNDVTEEEGTTAIKKLSLNSYHHFHLISFKLEMIYMDCPLTSVFTQVTSTAIRLEYPLSQQFSLCVDTIVGSCHGILCIQLDDFSVVLWNPSIRKLNKLPSLEEEDKISYEYFFGYDHSSDTYKVVACGSFKTGNGFLINLVKVHTLGTNSWRRIQDFPSSGFLCQELSGKFVCGTITWLAQKIPTSSSNIISLDLEKESYLEIAQLDYGRVTLTSLKLGELRDCLCIFSCTGTSTDIWLMKEYGNKESWIKLFRVPDIRDFGFDPDVRAVYVSEDDQVLLDMYAEPQLDIDGQSQLVVYNSSDGTFKNLNIENLNWRGAQVYHESLISPCF